MNVVKEAMDKTIPKSTHKFIYQIIKTPEIQQLGRSFNMLKQNAERNGWTFNNYNEYIRIRQELKEKCKEAYNKNWEENINKIIEVSKDSKAFGIR